MFVHLSTRRPTGLLVCAAAHAQPAGQAQRPRRCDDPPTPERLHAHSLLARCDLPTCRRRQQQRAATTRVQCTPLFLRSHRTAPHRPLPHLPTPRYAPRPISLAAARWNVLTLRACQQQHFERTLAPSGWPLQQQQSHECERVACARWRSAAPAAQCAEPLASALAHAVCVCCASGRPPAVGRRMPTQRRRQHSATRHDTHARRVPDAHWTSGPRGDACARSKRDGTVQLPFNLSRSQRRAHIRVCFQLRCCFFFFPQP